ncbi:AAA family ATPase [Chachezhania antarctica]|mgnify:CR=1 FL=1|uniref:AAA family ATPase n=1 Tax=Chachezhania antarctica TaxID=2340860 RepID=UPI000EB55FB8|nr:AAA family ATPase [Chachezhania antarctica]
MTVLKLDLAAALLHVGDEAHKLRPKTLNVLVALIERQGEVVSQQDLRDLVWGQRHGSDAGPKQCVRELRRLLGDDAALPTYIETVGRHGYRLLAPIEFMGGSTPHSGADPALCVGRGPQIQALTEAAAAARRGSRPVVLIAGEAGAGKTRLTDRFLSQRPARPALWVARGQAIPHPGAREAYGPLLEALSQISAGPAGATLGRLLHDVAPSWADQIPGQGRKRASATMDMDPERPDSMLRECADLMDRLTADHPGILVLEDLHWADPSTLAWLAAWGLRTGPARLMVIGTYRYDEVDRTSDLADTLRHLNRRPETRVLTLGGLSPGAVDDYLGQRLPGNTFPRTLAPLLAQRTEGHAILIDAAVGRWVEQGDILKVDGRWSLHHPPEALVSTMPASVTDFIDAEIERLGPDDRALLESASVAGAIFSGPSLADGAGAIEASERQLDTLASRHRFIEHAGHVRRPDGVIETRFAFRHALYHEALYNGIPAGIRQGLHRRIGTRLEQAYGRDTDGIAPTLADHFERAADWPRAAQYRGVSGLQALGRGAGQDAARQLRQALEMYARCDDPSRDLQAAELRVLQGLGAALIVSNGFTGDELRQVFSRAETLARSVRDPVATLPVLAGFWNYHISRAELARAGELAQSMDSLADTAPDHIAMAVHNAVGQTDFFLGAFPACGPRIETVLAMAEGFDQDGAETLFGEHPVIVCNQYAACVSQVLGKDADAEAYFAAGMQEAQALNQPFGQAQMLWAGAVMARLRGETETTLERADRLNAICRDFDMPHWRPAAGMLSGWARVMLGDEAGFDLFRDGQASFKRANVQLTRPFNLGLAAEMAAASGDAVQALTTLRHALAITRRTGERWYEAELFRLHASLMERVDRPVRARTALRRAVAAAAAQGAAGFERRARVQLASLPCVTGAGPTQAPG